MFSPAIIALLVALSAMAWVYSMSMRRTGNNSQTAYIVSALAGVIVFVFILSIVNLVDTALGN